MLLPLLLLLLPLLPLLLLLLPLPSMLLPLRLRQAIHLLCLQKVLQRLQHRPAAPHRLNQSVHISLAVRSGQAHT